MKGFLSCDRIYKQTNRDQSLYTELPTNAETSETTVRNLDWLFPYIWVPATRNLFPFLLNHLLTLLRAISKAEDLSLDSSYFKVLGRLHISI